MAQADGLIKEGDPYPRLRQVPLLSRLDVHCTKG